MKILSIAVIAVALFAFVPADILIGRWESKPSVNGNVTGVVFKPDNKFEGYVNKKPFVSGTYSLSYDTCTIIDNGCDGKEAVYKLVFFSNGDSLRFEHIRDSCTERRNGMTRLVLGKVK
jgi:hypothetical protein